MKPHRHSIRLHGYDYTSAGWYFVTICCKDREHLFGKIVGAYRIRPHIRNDISPREPQVILSQLGEVVRDEWLKTAKMRPEIELGEFVIMPNHFHAIIGITGTTVVPRNPMQTGVCDTPMQTGVCDTPMQTGVCDTPMQTGVCDTPMQTGVCDTPLRSPSKTIGAIIRGFKSAVTSHARRNGMAVNIWQRNYYEHIIRNEESYSKISDYIRNNPAQWQEDECFR